VSRHCPFCDVPQDLILFEADLALIIRDQFPVSPGHTLIVPRRHIGSFFEASAEEQSELLMLLNRAHGLVATEHRPDGFNIGINDGLAAGQTIPHLHIHLIPRYRGDRPDPRGGVRWILPEKTRYWTDR
jgi:diadenosine tetraphosphate (Ap4A) HIT family hydrolase